MWICRNTETVLMFIWKYFWVHYFLTLKVKVLFDSENIKSLRYYNQISAHSFLWKQGEIYYYCLKLRQLKTRPGRKKMRQNNQRGAYCVTNLVHLGRHIRHFSPWLAYFRPRFCAIFLFKSKPCFFFSWPCPLSRHFFKLSIEV